jgi:hypothetical protein
VHASNQQPKWEPQQDFQRDPQKYPAGRHEPTNRKLEYTSPNTPANQKEAYKAQREGYKPVYQNQGFSVLHSAPYRYDSKPDESKTSPSQKVVQSPNSAFRAAKAAFSEDQTDGADASVSGISLSEAYDPDHTFRDYDEKVQHKVALHRSHASSQYDDHVRRSQEQYRANVSRRRQYRTEAPPDSDVVLRRSRSLPRERTRGDTDNDKTPNSPGDRTSHRSRKSESDSRKIIIADYSANKRYRSQEDVSKTDDAPKVNISELKLKLFGQDGEKLVMSKPELKTILDPSQHRVATMRDQVFNAEDEKVPRYYSHHYISRSEAAGEDEDELLFDYVSYKDGRQPRHSNITDVLTDLEHTYEKLHLDSDEELLDRAGHHDMTLTSPTSGHHR